MINYLKYKDVNSILNKNSKLFSSIFCVGSLFIFVAGEKLIVKDFDFIKNFIKLLQIQKFD